MAYNDEHTDAEIHTCNNTYAGIFCIIHSSRCSFSLWGQGRHRTQRLGGKVHHPGGLRLSSCGFEFLFCQGHVEAVPTQRSRLRLERIMHLVPFVAESRKLDVTGHIQFRSGFKGSLGAILTSASRCSVPGIASRVLILMTAPVSSDASTSILSESGTWTRTSEIWRGRARISLGAGYPRHERSTCRCERVR